MRSPKTIPRSISLEETFEHVIIPALRLCEEDFRKGIVSESNRSEMHRLVRDLVLDVGPGAAPEVKEKEAEPGTVDNQSAAGRAAGVDLSASEQWRRMS